MKENSLGQEGEDGISSQEHFPLDARVSMGQVSTKVTNDRFSRKQRRERETFRQLCAVLI